MSADTNKEPPVPDRVSRPIVQPGWNRDMVVESIDLFANCKEVQIRHQGELYRLRLTKNGKLILNK